MPKRAFPAKPGMPLFGALHQKTEAFQNFAAPRCVSEGIFLGVLSFKKPLGLCFGVGWGVFRGKQRRRNMFFLVIWMDVYVWGVA